MAPCFGRCPEQTRRWSGDELVRFIGHAALARHMVTGCYGRRDLRIVRLGLELRGNCEVPQNQYVQANQHLRKIHDSHINPEYQVIAQKQNHSRKRMTLVESYRIRVLFAVLKRLPELLTLDTLNPVLY